MFLQTANKLVRNYITDIGMLHGYTEIQNFSSSEIFFQHEKRNFVSPCSHSNGDISRVKITRYFYMWGYHVFTTKLTWYFIGVCIINNIMTTEHYRHWILVFRIICQNYCRSWMEIHTLSCSRWGRGSNNKWYFQRGEKLQ